MELTGIILAVVGALVGALASSWYFSNKISELKERMLDKDLVISLLKTNTNKTKKNAYKANEIGRAHV